MITRSTARKSSDTQGSGRLLHIHTANSIAEAHVVASALDAEGIPVSLNGIGHASMAWDHLIALGGIKVMVPCVCKDAAATRLSATYFEPPAWQAPKFWRHWWLNAPFAIFGGLNGVGFPPWVREKNRFFLIALTVYVAGFLLFDPSMIFKLYAVILNR